MDAGTRQPQDLTGARRQEWASFLKALAAKKVVRGRSAGLGNNNTIDLYSFLTEGTRVPARVLAGLHWFVKLSGAAWDLNDLGRMPIAGKEGPSQAAVAEPSMVEELEHRIVRLYESGDPRWSCLLVDWLIMSGWAAPAHFPDGWSWAEASIEAYGALSAAKTRRQVTLFSQEAFRSLVRPETTYSWRRVVPSMGTLLSLQEVDLVSLGDWQDRGKVAASAAALPLYYSGTRYALSVRNKHLVLVEMSRCLSFDSWQEVSRDRLDASDSWLQDMKAEKVRLDGTTIWKDLVGTPGQWQSVLSLPPERDASLPSFADIFLQGLRLFPCPPMRDGIEAPGDVPSVITAPEEAPAGATRREPPGLNLVLRRSPSLRRAPIEVTAQGQEDAPQGARGGECAIRSGSRQAASMVGPSGWVYDLIVREVSAPSSFIKLPCSSVGATRKEQPRGTKRPRQDDEEHFDLGERIGRRTLAEPCRRRRRSSAAEPAITAMAQSPSARGGIVLPGALHSQWNITSGARHEEDFQAILPLVKYTLWEGDNALVQVQAKLLAEGFSNLEELRFLFDNEEHVGRWVALTDLDTMLEDAELRDVKLAFWKRKLGENLFPEEVETEEAVPSGAVGPPTPPPPQVSHFREGNKANGKRTAAVLKDGTRLCPDF
eukprot:s1149_g9.t2